MSIKLNLNIQQANMIADALEEYESNHYEAEDEVWQIVIDELITTIEDEIYNYKVFKTIKERQDNEYKGI